MNANLDLIKTNWTTEVNDISSVEEKGQRTALPIHTVVAQFKLLGDNNLLGELDTETIDKFKTISDEKIKYYRSSRFGFIKELFSKLRNLFTVGQFISSGQLGYNLADRFLNPPAPTVEQDETQAEKAEKAEKPEKADKKPEVKEVEDEESFSDQEEEPAQRAASQQKKAAPKSMLQEPEEDINEKGDIEIYSFAPDEEKEAPSFPTLKDEWGKTKEKAAKEGLEVEKEEDESDDDLFKDVIDTWEEEAAPAVATPAPAPEAVAAPRQPSTKSPRDMMEASLLNVWKHSDADKSDQILKAWNALFKGAKITGWGRIGTTIEYTMTLEKPVTGTINLSPLVNLYLSIPKEMNILFSEREENDEWKQVMTFVTPIEAKALRQNGNLFEIIVDSSWPYRVHLHVDVPATFFSKAQNMDITRSSIKGVIDMLGEVTWN